MQSAPSEASDFVLLLTKLDPEQRPDHGAWLRAVLRVASKRRVPKDVSTQPFNVAV